MNDAFDKRLLDILEGVTCTEDTSSWYCKIMRDSMQTGHVVGHRNPDTDSVASAIAYAAFKRRLGHDNVIAAMAGAPNPQTSYILNRLGWCRPVPGRRASQVAMCWAAADTAGADMPLKGPWAVPSSCHQGVAGG